MKKVTAATATTFAIIVGISAPPAYAEDSSEGQAELTTTDLKVATDDFWTPKRIEMAMANSKTEPIDGDNKTQQFQAQSDDFPEEPWDQVAYPDWPTPTPDPVVHDGIEYPRTVGKLLMSKHVDGEQPSYYTCTATAVSSESESLLITAGHCIWPEGHSDVSSNVRFIPAYHITDDGKTQRPFGDWDATAAIGLDCWIYDLEDECDQAFLKIAPRKSDGATLQNITGSDGLTVGGSPVRGSTPEEPYLPELTMHSYPVGVDGDMKPDPGRVYLCEGTSSAADQALFSGGIQIPCDEPITGGASGAAFVEHGQSGRTVIATFKGSVKGDNAQLALLNNSETKSMHHNLDEYIPLS